MTWSNWPPSHLHKHQVFKFNFVCITKPSECYISNPHDFIRLPCGCLANITTEHVMREYTLWAYVNLFANTKSKPSHKLFQYKRSSLVVGWKCTDEELGKCQAKCVIHRAEVFSWRLKFILQNGVPVNELWWFQNIYIFNKTSRILTYIFIQLQSTWLCFIIIWAPLVKFKTHVLWCTLFTNLCAILLELQLNPPNSLPYVFQISQISFKYFTLHRYFHKDDRHSLEVNYLQFFSSFSLCNNKCRYLES